MKRIETSDETVRFETTGVYDKDGEPWTGAPAGWACLIFVVLVALVALASLVASVLKVYQ